MSTHQSLVNYQAKTTKYTKGNHAGKGLTYLERELPSLCSSWPWITKRFSLMFQYNLLLFDRILQRLCSLKTKISQLPCFQFLSLKSGRLAAWLLRTAVARALLPLITIIFAIAALVSELHPAASILCHHQVPVIICISLYIYLNDTLDEQRVLLYPSGT